MYMLENNYWKIQQMVDFSCKFIVFFLICCPEIQFSINKVEKDDKNEF